MDNRDIVYTFFNAENERNWELYEQFLHSEVFWKLFSKEKKEIIRIENKIS